MQFALKSTDKRLYKLPFAHLQSHQNLRRHFRCQFQQGHQTPHKHHLKLVRLHQALQAPENEKKNSD